MLVRQQALWRLRQRPRNGGGENVGSLSTKTPPGGGRLVNLIMMMMLITEPARG